MPYFSRQVGNVSQLVTVFLPDATVSTGKGLANVVASTVRLTWWRDNQSAVSSWTLTTGTLGTWAASTFTQVGSTSSLGMYQVSLPDGMFASGTNAAAMIMSSTATFADVPLIFDLSSQILGVSSVSAPVGVSTLPAITSMTVGVNVTSIHGSAAVTSAAGVFGPLEVSSLTTPVTVSSGSVNASTVSDKTGYSASAGVTTVTIPVGVSSGSVAVTSATAAVYEAAADALLNRHLAGGANTGRLVKEALYPLRNRVDLSTGLVYEPDDTTTSWAFAVSTTPGDPVYLIDPA